VGLRDEAVLALRKTRTLTRGPKPVQALKENELVPTAVAVAPTTEGVIATLAQRNLRGVTVGVQLFGMPNPALAQFLAEAGAIVREVQPYEYAPGADADRVADLVRAASHAEVDVFVFTSSPQVDRWYEVIAEKALEAEWGNALQKVLVAAVGPVVAETIRSKGGRVDIAPSQGFVMKNLVQHIKKALTPRPGPAPPP
jgi:uroporphyrinogen-III synthase